MVVWMHAGEPELLMASHVLHRGITVYRLAGGTLTEVVTYNEELDGERVRVLWSGAHYDALLSAPQQPQSKL